MSIIVRRPVLEGFLTREGRRLLYGRRKTGKTFYTRLTLSSHHYYIVRRDGSFYDPVDDYSIDLKGILRECRRGDPLIIDEFHRAPVNLFYAIQAGECPGSLTLLTSTLHLYKRILSGSDSPLLGMFKTMRVGLISPVDLLATQEIASLVESDPSSLARVQYYQEPSWIGSSLNDIIYGAYDFTQAIIGEILEEEDIAHTRRLHAVLAAVAAGKTRLSEIASYAHNMGYAPSPSTGHIVKYIDQAVKTGLLEKIPVHGAKKRGVYRHYSPVTYTGMYLQERYSFYEASPPLGEASRIVESITPLLLEIFIERLLVDLYGLRPVKVLNPEIDVALARGRRIIVAAEVKWRAQLRRSDITRVEENMQRLQAPVQLLIVPDKTMVPYTPSGRLKVIDAIDLVEYSRERKPPLQA